AGPQGRALVVRRTALADRARRAAPAGLRPRGAGRGAGDVRPAEPDPGRLPAGSGRGEAAQRAAGRRREAARRGGAGRRIGPSGALMASSAAWLVVAGALILLAGVFAAADSAVSVVSKARVAGMVRSGRSGARQLAAVVEDRTRHINLLLLLRLGCELTATVLVTVVLLRWIESEWLAVLVAAAVMLVISYVLVGVGPRTIARQHPYGVGSALAGLVRLLGFLLGPLSRLLIWLGNAIVPGGGFREGPFTSEIEVREIVDLARERGVVEDSERAMIHSVFELGDTLAREVMVPRTEIVWIERTKTVRQALALSLRTGYSRIPVIGENVDDVVGVVNIKDLVR